MELDGPLEARLGTTALRVSHGRAAASRGKRTLDVAVAVAALALLCVLLALVSAAITFWDRGPVLSRQTRIGRNGVPFACLKFRTEALHGRRGESIEPPRDTLLGRVLKETGIDELPQLVNVIRGEMSLVGPRAITPEEADRYRASLADYMVVRPGLTGLWQCRIDVDPEVIDKRSVALNREYVRRWSFWRDLAIMMKAVPVVVMPRRTGLAARNTRSSKG